jgi:hypothetical protein
VARTDLGSHESDCDDKRIVEDIQVRDKWYAMNIDEMHYIRRENLTFVCATMNITLT